MQTKDAVRERRSIRKFKPDQVPPELIRDLLDTARWAPSGGNMQTWQFYVLTGKSLAQFKAANVRKTMEKGKPDSDVAMSASIPEDFQLRYMEFAESMFTSIGVKREDKAARGRFYQDMANLFDAPCLIVSCIPQSMSPEYPMFDLGLITQTICLLAHDHGLGTLIMYQAVMYPSILRELAAIPDDQRIAASIALGYPAPDATVNHFLRTRRAVDDFVRWID